MSIDIMKIKDELMEVAFNEILKEGEIIAGKAIQNAPVGETGNLIIHLKSRPIGKIGTSVGPKSFYAGWNEYGTVKQAPNPFMRKVLVEYGQKAADNIVNELQKVIQSKNG